MTNETMVDETAKVVEGAHEDVCTDQMVDATTKAPAQMPGAATPGTRTSGLRTSVAGAPAFARERGNMTNESFRARFIGTFITSMERTHEQTGQIDTNLADKIESLLWPRLHTHEAHMNAITISSGTIIHLNGIPLTLTADATVTGTPENMELARPFVTPPVTDQAHDV